MLSKLQGLFVKRQEPSTSEWRTLPGRQIELGATGVRIEHDTDCEMIRLYAPNGELIASAGMLQLQGMKEIGATYAKNLAEFDA